MPTKSTEIMLTVSEDMEMQLGKHKKEFFYNQNTSEMIRELILAGLRSLEDQPELDTQGQYV